MLLILPFYSFAENINHMESNPNQEITYGKFYSYTFKQDDVECEGLTISGYMFGHAHGLPTEPTITKKKDSKCQVDGLYFNMPGVWKIVIKKSNDIIHEHVIDVK